MSIRSLGELALRRRVPAAAAGAAASAPAEPAASGLSALEAALPADVIALYTAIIAGCEGVLADDPEDTYLAFRVVVYLIGFVCTAYAASRIVKPAMGSGWIAALRSPEVQTAVLAFAAWGLVLPGSFLYVWLSSSLLSITLVTITATSTFLLAVVYTPQLRQTEVRTPAGGRGEQPPLVPAPTPPGRAGGGTAPQTPPLSPSGDQQAPAGTLPPPRHASRGRGGGAQPQASEPPDAP
jgi:hypothetical protein